MEKWELLSSKYIYKDRWLKLRSNSYRTPAGAVVEPYYLREITDWVNCVAVDTDLNVIMLNHYRPGCDSYLRELPAGGIEASDADPTAAIRRELLEETGYTGGEIYELNGYWPNPGLQTNRNYTFVALGGECKTLVQPDSHETAEVIKQSFPELLADIHQTRPVPLYQPNHLATIFQAQHFINHSNHPDAIKLQAQLNTR